MPSRILRTLRDKRQRCCAKKLRCGSHLIIREEALRMNSDRSVLIGIGKRTEFSHAECVREHQLLECRVPFEINNVIRIEAGYMS